MMRAAMSLLAMGCVARAPSPVADPSESASQVQRATTTGRWTLLDNVHQIWCEADGCGVKRGDTATAIDADTLTLGAAVKAPPAGAMFTLAEGLPPIQETWNQIIANGWRSPFANRIPTPDGGTLSYVRGLGSGQAQLIRSGGGIRMRPAPDVSGPVAHPRWLALHQTGHQAYLVAWPHTEVIAIDPSSLMTVWRADMEDAVVGLFIDPSGRYLVVETGGVAPPAQLLDFPVEPPLVLDGVDPYGDPQLASLPRPTATHTVVVDVQSVEIAMDAPGTFRAWTAVPGGGALIATSKGIGRLP